MNMCKRTIFAVALTIASCSGFEPPVPWNQHGSAVATILQVPTALADSLLPEDVRLDPQFKIKSSFARSTTTGSFYLASYDASSSVTYNELIVSCGTISFNPSTSVNNLDTPRSAAAGSSRNLWSEGYESRRSYSGGWLSNVYVDDQNALEAGKEVWGIDKKMAVFNRTLADDGQTHIVRVTDPESGALIVAVTYLDNRGPTFPMTTNQTTISVSLDDSEQVLYSVTGESFQVKVVDSSSGIDFEVPTESPLYTLLGDGGTSSGVAIASTSLLNNCTMDMEPPSIIGEMVV